MNCIFCEIAKKERKSLFIYEDDYVMGVLDINPIAPGHTFLIPKKHFQNVLELDEETPFFLWKGIVEVEKMLIKAFNPQGFTLGINQGSSAGQAIDHLHIHIVPRWQNDGGTSLHGVVNNPPHESLEEIYQKIMASNK